MVDRFQIALRRQHFQPRFISIFFMATSEPRRLSRFLVCRQPPLLMATSGTLRDVALGGSCRKWCTATPLVCFLISHSFFCANFLFCSQVPALYPPCRRTWLPSPSRAYQAPLLTVTTALIPYSHWEVPRTDLVTSRRKSVDCSLILPFCAMEC